MRTLLWRLRNLILGRRYGVAVDPGGVFIPETLVVYYTDRRGNLHIESIKETS